MNSPTICTSQLDASIHFFSGIHFDQTIEQTLMKLMNIEGGSFRRGAQKVLFTDGLIMFLLQMISSKILNRVVIYLLKIVINMLTARIPEYYKR